MKHFMRPDGCLGSFLVAALAAGVLLAPVSLTAQSHGIVQLLRDSNPLTRSSPGYLGVDVTDVDAGKVQVLKLKGAQGALITLIDHDAPAGKVGLRVNDVVLQLNGKTVDNAAAFRKLLHNISAGHKANLQISRDGSVMNLTTDLVNRKAVEKEVWKRIGDGGDVFTSTPAMGMLAGSEGDAPTSGGFHIPFFGSSLNVGALVEPLTSQMADYLGVAGGIMVKQVAHKSEADLAGFKAFDVILKVGTENINTCSDWDRALRSNRDKPVAVTILRDKKQQTLTLQVDSKHRSAMTRPELVTRSGQPLA